MDPSLLLNSLKFKLQICGHQSLDASQGKPPLTSKHAIKITRKFTPTAQSLLLNSSKFRFNLNGHLLPGASLGKLQLILRLVIKTIKNFISMAQLPLRNSNNFNFCKPPSLSYHHGHLSQDANLVKLLQISRLVIKIIKKFTLMDPSLLPNSLKFKLLTCGHQSLDANQGKPPLTSKHAIKITRKFIPTAQSLLLNLSKFNSLKNSDQQLNATTQTTGTLQCSMAQRLLVTQSLATLMTTPTLDLSPRTSTDTLLSSSSLEELLSNQWKSDINLWINQAII